MENKKNHPFKLINGGKKDLTREVCIMELFWQGKKERAFDLMCRLLEKEIMAIIKQFGIPGYMKEDARQEGYLVILEEMNRYDPKRKGAVTYFRPYIMHGIAEYARNNTYGCSKYYMKQLKKVEKMEREALQEKKILTIDEIRKFSGQNYKNCIMALEQKGRMKNTISFDEAEVAHTGISEEYPVEDIVFHKMDMETMYEALKKIDERSRDIITKYYGLYDGIPYSYVELALEYKASQTAMRREMGKILSILRFFMEMEINYTGQAHRVKDQREIVSLDHKKRNEDRKITMEITYRVSV
ncbi:MAG: sigma-70 family RNA polymerase sigma factor [Eubacteriales bacterium]|nr:sigma-70 family RNA polymerase sigma factor [Eubacteriales bacterium]